MDLQIQLNGKNDLSKSLFIEVYEDGLDVNGSEANNFAHAHSSLFTNYSFTRLLDAVDASDLQIIAIAGRINEPGEAPEQRG